MHISKLLGKKCSKQFWLDSTAEGEPFKPYCKCSRPPGHKGRHAASMFYEVKRWGAPLPEGCIRFETALEPAKGYEAQVHDTIVDLVSCEQVWQ